MKWKTKNPTDVYTQTKPAHIIFIPLMHVWQRVILIDTDWGELITNGLILERQGKISSFKSEALSLQPSIKYLSNGLYRVILWNRQNRYLSLRIYVYV